MDVLDFIVPCCSRQSFEHKVHGAVHAHTLPPPSPMLQTLL